MTLTVKLPEEVEREFEIHCRTNRITKSEVVTQLLRQYLAVKAPRRSPFELAMEMGLVGALDDAPRDLAKRHSTHVKRAINGKRSR